MIQLSIKKRPALTYSHNTILENVNISLPSKLVKASGINKDDAVEITHECDLLRLKHLGYIKIIGRDQPFVRLRGYNGSSLGLYGSKFPRLLEQYDFPARRIKIEAVVIDDELVIDISEFKKQEKPKVGFGLLKVDIKEQEAANRQPVKKVGFGALLEKIK
jgi:hypothetical protein